MYLNHCNYIQVYLWIVVLGEPQALASSCQVYPSEYAYLDSSVNRQERASANCRRYPPMHHVASIHPEDYTHCDGTQLRLTDSDFGSEVYSNSDYYVWFAGSSATQLLFIFPTTVNLTTITLHYYSDNDHWLPSVRYYAVGNGFEIWNAPAVSFGFTDVQSQDREPTGHRNVSTKVSFDATKVLMYISGSSFHLAVSELQFFSLNEPTSQMIRTTSPSQSKIDFPTTEMIRNSHTTQHFSQDQRGITHASSDYQAEFSTSQQESVTLWSDEKFMISLATGVTITVLILLLAIVVLAVLLRLWCKNRTNKTSNSDKEDGVYCILDRGTKLQPQTQYACTKVYDQIQLSPSTGQSESMSEMIEGENVNISVPPTQLDCENMEKQQKIEPNKSSLLFATYATVNKTKKKKSKEELISESHDTTSNKVIPLNKNSESLTPVKHVRVDNPKHEQNENLEEMYAVVQKPKKQKNQGIAPPVPSHTIESLYTAVQKIPKQ